MCVRSVSALMQNRFTNRHRIPAPHPALVAGIAALLTFTTFAHAAGDSISRAEFLAMRREMSEMRSEISALKAEKAAREGGGAPAMRAGSSTLAALNARINEVAKMADLSKSGETKALITGSGSTTFSTASHDKSNFSATFAPVLLWHLNDRLHFEGEVEFQLEGTDTGLNLEYAQLTYSLNDYMTLGAGKFLAPMSAFIERYEPKWINKLPDTPLAIYDGILPEGNLGFQLRGVIPAGPTRVNYAAYVSNAPRLITDDPGGAGQLEFNNYTSLNDNKAVGGRVGFMPCPNFEIGYGVQYSRVRGEGGGRSVGALLQAVDLSTYYEALKGRFTLLGEYAWSNVGSRTYDIGGGSITFNNKRQGGYVQLSYRAKQFDSDFINRLEFIARADRSHTPHDAPGGFDEHRLTFGLDYWLTGSTVLKTAWEVDHRDNGEPNGNAFLIGVATGL